MAATESYKRSTGLVLEEYLPALTGERGKRIMRTMIEDPTYGGIMFIISSIFRSLQWTIELPKEVIGNPDAEMKRTYLQSVLFDDIGTRDDPDSWCTYDDYVQMALGGMLPWGYALIHPVLKNAPTVTRALVDSFR